MNKLALFAIALGLVTGGCKKDKKDEGAGKATGSGSEMAGKKDPAAGSDKASGSGEASASGSGEASASGSGEASASGSGAAPAAGALKIDLKIAAVGSIAVKDEQRISDLVIDNKGQKIPMHVDERKLHEMKVVEATDFVQKVELKVEMDHKTTTMGGKDKAEKSPLEGKAYVVWNDGGKVNATNADGTPVQPDELEEISDSFDDELGRVPGIAIVLTSHTWNPGEEVTLTPDELLVLASGQDGGKVLSTKITLVDQDNGKANFKVVSETQLENDKLVGKLDMTLTVTLDIAECRPLRIEAAGKLDGSAAGTPIAGDMNGLTTYTY